MHQVLAKSGGALATPCQIWGGPNLRGCCGALMPCICPARCLPSRVGEGVQVQAGCATSALPLQHSETTMEPARLPQDTIFVLATNTPFTVTPLLTCGQADAWALHTSQTRASRRNLADPSHLRLVHGICWSHMQARKVCIQAPSADHLKSLPP